MDPAEEAEPTKQEEGSAEVQSSTSDDHGTTAEINCSEEEAFGTPPEQIEKTETIQSKELVDLKQPELPQERRSEDLLSSPMKSPVDTVPDDIEKMTIRNLDTGEKFIIGESDPDFDLDTFELRGGAELAAEQRAQAAADSQTSRRERVTWWNRLMRYIYTNNATHKQESSAPATITEADLESQEINNFKTPFTKLSSFKFRRELGRGAFGRVLLAEAKVDGKLYALKIIAKKNMRSSDKRQAKAERDILLAMGQRSPHPFTAGLKFAFQSENNLYLGMDFFSGGTLRELIKRFKCLPEDWVIFYTAELVLAISHLHSLHVLYRDIKPHNVMIDGKGHIVLIDFGLSKQEICSPRGAMSLVGTPDYSAPEVLKTGVFQIEQHNKQKASLEKGQRPKKPSKTPSNIGYGKAADWWSLGVMVYEMLAGTPAFRGSDLRETYQKVLFADLEFKPQENFSPAARLLIAGLLRRDPSLRLGAWDNPPTDIMKLSFFANVNWEDLYNRTCDGPWVPDPVTFRDRDRSVSTAQSGLPKLGGPVQAIGPGAIRAGAITPIAGTKFSKPAIVANANPAGGGGGGACDPIAEEEKFDGYDEVMVQSGEQKKRAGEISTPNADAEVSGQDSAMRRIEKLDRDIEQEAARKKKVGASEEATATATPEYTSPNEAKKAKEEDSDESDGEYIPMRDSIIISGRNNKTNPNALQDWSFMDVNALAEAAKQGEKPAANASATTFVPWKNSR